MTSKTCNACGEDKPLESFPKVGRGRRATCTPCLETPAAAEPVSTDHLEMLAGFGFEAWLEGGSLHLRQHDAEGNADTIMLSRTEAKVLFAHYAEWAK